MKTISATVTRSKKKHGKIKGMKINLMSNGATSTMMHEPAEGAMFPGQEEEGEQSVHPTMAHLVKHIKANVGDHFAANTGMGGASPATQPTSKPTSGGAAGNNDAEADEDEDE